MSGIITLTTDFGWGDAYVAAVKGVMLSVNPQAQLINVSHDIRPQNIAQAAFMLGTVYSHFPPGTVHLAVVDPGVGTERQAIALAAAGALFVGPDNGLFTYVLADVLGPEPESAVYDFGPQPRLHPRPLGDLEAVVLTEPSFWRHPVSATFHGRDIFAPVAAHLAQGVALSSLGTPLNSLLTFRPPQPRQEPDGSLVGHIIHVDTFGNLITDIRDRDLPPEPFVIQVAGQRLDHLSHHYAEGGRLMALMGSSGRLEVAVPMGNAGQLLGLREGDLIRIIRFSGG